ncbi:MAG: Si-specific NAD(P)(+) transhydrogenase [Candidatus Rokuibacteriota bacterium]|nr:MAG: Si-specific NAD(P)(+) transhydrogenase [Candidatus Rokubacteria bacterium]
MSPDFGLVCIGSGPAGQRAAVQAAKLGCRVAVVEKQPCLGGACVDTGTIPSKTFREAVLSFAALRRQGHPGRPLAADLLARVEQVSRREREVIDAQLERNDVTVIHGEASFVGPHTVAITSDLGVRTVSADRFIVAVGTTPAPAPGVGADGEVIITSDDLVRMHEVPRTLAVVGGGVIGIEYASMFAALGVQVTLVEQRERPLDFVDRELVDELIHQMRARQVTFRLGEAVKSFDVADTPRGRAVLALESGKRLVTDVALFSAGRVAATARLGLEAAGLVADARGRLAVDETFRTAVPHIYAAGDVIGYPSLAATSSEQGRLAACHALGVKTGPMARHFPVGIYAIPELSTVGSPEFELTRDRVPYEVGVARYREIARGHLLEDDSGFLKMLFHRDDRRLLGVHVLGSGATELIHIGQAVLGLGGGLNYFMETVFNYPTLAECYKVAALDAYNKLAR